MENPFFSSLFKILDQPQKKGYVIIQDFIRKLFSKTYFHVPPFQNRAIGRTFSGSSILYAKN